MATAAAPDPVNPGRCSTPSVAPTDLARDLPADEEVTKIDAPGVRCQLHGHMKQDSRLPDRQPPTTCRPAAGPGRNRALVVSPTVVVAPGSLGS